MKKEWTMESASVMPVIALRGLTVFPNVLIHFDVAREISIKALEEAMSSGSPVFLVGQKDISEERPEEKDLYTVGTISNVRQILRTPGDNVRVMVEGVSRGGLERLTRTVPYLEAEVQPIPNERNERNSAKAEALIRSTYELFQQYTELAPKTAPDLLINVLASEDPGYIADFIAQNIAMRNSDKQAVLEELRPVRRLERLHRLLGREVEILGLDMEIQNRAREQMADNQRDYYLREQLKAIQNELGEGEGGDSEIGDYRRRIAEAKLPDEVREKLEKEVGRLAKQPFGSSEATVLRSYLDVCLELPWGKKTRERVSVETARRTLDKDHFGLEKVKERILEFLAVKQLAPDLKGQVICLVGPPGVGKTSVAMSVARALNRKLARLSLGGVSDEAEIRGHRKTYVGAMPGRIISAINQAGSCNPLLLLDEIDKLGHDHRGDPASALLEVLDAEQNSTFRDNFLELPFDLSDVMFITTANTTDTIPRPLLDRMEVIELPSYTDEEKLQIAKRYLLPKEMKRHGLEKAQLKVSDGAIREMVASYTRESGVRVLERKLAAICRKAAMHLVSEDVKQIRITEKELKDYLGAPRYYPERQALEERVGVVNGLAWTSVGGELLEVEVNVVPGTGKVELTGNLGDVMKESRPCGPQLHPQPGGPAGHPGGLLPVEGHPCPLPRGGRAQGRALRRHRHHHRHGVRPHRSAGEAGARHDRRGDPPGPGAAHRRPAGKDHGRPAQWDQDGDHPGGKREGSGGDRPDGPEGPALRAGGPGGAGAGRGPVLPGRRRGGRAGDGPEAARGEVPGDGPAAPVRRGAYVHQRTEGGVHPLRRLPKGFPAGRAAPGGLRGPLQCGKVVSDQPPAEPEKFRPGGGRARQDHPNQLF